MRVGTVLMAFLFGGAALVAAQLPDAEPRFEVVSVKPSNSSIPGFRTGPVTPGGIWKAEHIPLTNLLMTAFGTEFYMEGRTRGIQAWMSEAFDIEARVPAGARRRDLPVMLKALLADRFGLRTHMERRSFDAYVMKLLRGDGTVGPQLHPASPACAAARASDMDLPDACHQRRERLPAEPNQLMIVDGVAIGSLPTVLFEGWVHRPVIDRTGLTGYYDLRLQFDPTAGAPAGARGTGESILDAVETQLGLKLQPAREELDVLVIDTIHRPESN